jgi:hypothetical protein
VRVANVLAVRPNHVHGENKISTARPYCGTSADGSGRGSMNARDKAAGGGSGRYAAARVQRGATPHAESSPVLRGEIPSAHRGATCIKNITRRGWRIIHSRSLASGIVRMLRRRHPPQGGLSHDRSSNPRSWSGPAKDCPPLLARFQPDPRR